MVDRRRWNSAYIQWFNNWIVRLKVNDILHILEIVTWHFFPTPKSRWVTGWMRKKWSQNIFPFMTCHFNFNVHSLCSVMMFEHYHLMETNDLWLSELSWDGNWLFPLMTFEFQIFQFQVFMGIVQTIFWRGIRESSAQKLVFEWYETTEESTFNVSNDEIRC